MKKFILALTITLLSQISIYGMETSAQGVAAPAVVLHKSHPILEKASEVLQLKPKAGLYFSMAGNVDSASFFEDLDSLLNSNESRGQEFAAALNQLDQLSQEVLPNLTVFRAEQLKLRAARKNLQEDLDRMDILKTELPQRYEALKLSLIQTQ
jgi:hypothetical protein